MTRKANDGNVILSDVPEIPAAVSERLRPYHNTRFATFVDWSLDGTGIYISTRFASVPQLHRVDAPGGMRRQLTFSAEPIREGVRRPGTDELLYSMDAGGGEFFQLFLLRPGQPSGTLLTDGSSRNVEPKWSDDGRQLAFTSTRRDGRSMDLWVLDPDRAGSAALVLGSPDGSSWSAVDWSPRSNHVLVQQYVSITDSRLHVLDLDTGELRHLVGGSETEATHFGIGFDAGGGGVYLLTDRGGEFTQLAHLSLTSGRLDPLTGEIPWNVEAAALNAARTRLAFTTNEDGWSRLHVLGAQGGGERQELSIPAGVAYGLRFDAEGTRLGFTLDTGTEPGEAYSIEVETEGPGAPAASRWTFSELGGLDAREFVAPRTIRFTSFDGLEVPAFLYQPAGPGPHPVIVNLHGGPESQSRPAFAGIFQSWLRELGVAVLDPNVRGSSGYGKTYLKLDNGFLREDSVRDIGALLDWIANQPALDATRVMVYGGSYGGYMVLASLVHFGERLRGGVDIVGISDFVTFLENTQDYRRDLRRVEYGDERDPEMRSFLESISPLRNAERITAPLFVIQGQNDPRVPVTEAEQIVASVRAMGRPVWYMNALNEGHGYARKENQELLRDSVYLFIQRFLLS
jgi:dipeptidyl aminopeptidase/acylaminoacyl peptidase